MHLFFNGHIYLTKAYKCAGFTIVLSKLLTLLFAYFCMRLDTIIATICCPTVFAQPYVSSSFTLQRFSSILYKMGVFVKIWRHNVKLSFEGNNSQFEREFPTKIWVSRFIKKRKLKDLYKGKRKKVVTHVCFPFLLLAIKNRTSSNRWINNFKFLKDK